MSLNGIRITDFDVICVKPPGIIASSVVVVLYVSGRHCLDSNQLLVGVGRLLKGAQMFECGWSWEGNDY
jgi:hypothetical protein